MSALKKTTLLEYKVPVSLYQATFITLWLYLMCEGTPVSGSLQVYPTPTSEPFPKQYILPGILFLQAVKWSFPSFKQLLKSHQSSSLLILIGQLTGFIFFFLGGLDWTWNTHSYPSLPDHVLSPHCLTFIEVHLPFISAEFVLVKDWAESNVCCTNK